MKESQRKEDYEILLVEDNPGDVRLVELALEETALSANLVVAPDGQAALTILRREGAQHEARLPDIILLDLRLPGVDGSEVLAQLSADPELMFIPVVALTGSPEFNDVTMAFQSGAASHVTKPTDPSKLAAILTDLDSGWLKTVSGQPQTLEPR